MKLSKLQKRLVFWGILFGTIVLLLLLFMEATDADSPLSAFIENVSVVVLAFFMIMKTLLWTPVSVALCLIGVASCDAPRPPRPTTEFFKIKEVFTSQRKKEFYVLSNAPYNTESLKKTVEEYNRQTLSIDTIKKYGWISRVFYRETSCLTRNYEEGELYPDAGCPGSKQYPRQHIGNHAYEYEFLMSTDYVISPMYPDEMHYTYLFRGKRGKNQSSTIKTPDSLPISATVKNTAR